MKKRVFFFFYFFVIFIKETKLFKNEKVLILHSVCNNVPKIIKINDIIKKENDPVKNVLQWLKL